MILMKWNKLIEKKSIKEEEKKESEEGEEGEEGDM